MSRPLSRREMLARFGSAGAGALLRPRGASARDRTIRVGGRAVEIAVTRVSARTVRISLSPFDGARPRPVPSDGSLVGQDWGAPRARLTTLARAEKIGLGELIVEAAPDPLVITVEARGGRPVQSLRVDQKNGSLFFDLGEGPLLGLGEGGPQFDRRGQSVMARSGQGGYRLRT